MKSVQSVVSLFLFVLIGVLTAAVGELQYSVFIRGDWANLVGSMVFNAVYLTGAFVVTRLLFRLLPCRMPSGTWKARSARCPARR